jgi:hypothetical protein
VSVVNANASPKPGNKRQSAPPECARGHRLSPTPPCAAPDLPPRVGRGSLSDRAALPVSKDLHEPELTPQRVVIISILLLLACAVLFAAIAFLVSV